MCMDQAKHYYICYDVFWYSTNFAYKILREILEKESKRKQFDCLVFTQHLKDLGFKTANRRGNVIHIFCGKKKLKQLLTEAHLLGLEDELLIFERK